jgi:DNA processing protein
MKKRVHALLSLTLIEGLGPVKLKHHLEKRGSPMIFLHSFNSSIRNDVMKRADEINEEVKALGARVVSYHCKEYPDNLKRIVDPPAVIFVKGIVPERVKQSISIVGTRKSCPEGRRLAEKAVELMVQHKFPLVSGMALGIDTASHKAALLNGLPTVAVLAHGLDRIHPKQNIKLAQRILEDGGALISEHPPRTPISKWMFAARNRILVGISAATVLAESPRSGGSLISVKIALREGRQTYAFTPPSSFDKRWDGNRFVIEEGRGIAISNMTDWYRSLLKEVPDLRTPLKDVESKVKKVRTNEVLKQIPEKCKSVYIEVSKESKSPQEISRVLRIEMRVLRTRLFILEAMGFVKRLPGDSYSPS